MITSHTLAGISSQVVCAGGSILAGVGGAFIHLLLAVAAGVAGLAAAEMSIATVNTEPRVPAEMCYVDTSLLSSHLAGHTGDIAVEPCPATVALAVVQVAGLPALASVFAGRGVTPTHQVLAVEPGVPLGTGALVRPVAVLTRAPVQAWLGVTLIDVVLTVAAREAGQAHTGEGVDAIHARPTIEAGALCAVRGVVLAVDAAEARGAGAGVAVDTVGAVGPVLAGVAGALIDVLLALGPTETSQALTEERANAIRAGATVVAWIGLAVVDVGVAVAAGEAGPAGTAVAPVGVLARGPIPAGALHTLIDVNLTGLTLPASGATAGEALVVL